MQTTLIAGVMLALMAVSGSAGATPTANGTRLYLGPGGSQATDGTGIYGTDPATQCAVSDKSAPGAQLRTGCVKLEVKCGAGPLVPPRYRISNNEPDVIVRYRLPDTSLYTVALGSIIFNEGSASDTFYGKPTLNWLELPGQIWEKHHTIDDAVAAGYQTFEVKWLQAPAAPTAVNAVGLGMFSGVEGYGGAVAMCGVSEVIEWLSLNATPSSFAMPQRLCATGNSNGGEQIAYALSAYNADRYLKKAVLTGGPSWTRIAEACAATPWDVDQTSLGLPSFHAGGKAIMEWLIDVPAGTCASYQNGNPVLVSAAQIRLARRSSLISVLAGGVLNPAREYAPRTSISMISGVNDSSGAYVHATDYFNTYSVAPGYVIDRSGDVTSGPDSFLHNIHNTATGRANISSALLTGNACTFDDVLP
jgi:hypothetical protein